MLFICVFILRRAIKTLVILSHATRCRPFSKYYWDIRGGGSWLFSRTGTSSITYLRVTKMFRRHSSQVTRIKRWPSYVTRLSWNNVQQNPSTKIISSGKSTGFPLQSHPGQLPSSSALSSAPTNYFRKIWVLNKSRHLGGTPHSLYAKATTYIAIRDTKKQIWITYDESTRHKKSTRPAETEVTGYELYQHQDGVHISKTT